MSTIDPTHLRLTARIIKLLASARARVVPDQIPKGVDTFGSSTHSTPHAVLACRLKLGPKERKNFFVAVVNLPRRIPEGLDVGCLQVGLKGLLALPLFPAARHSWFRRHAAESRTKNGEN